MTGNADTIKEFLVALGWKIDENSFKKFDDATGLTTRKVGAMALGMVAAGAAVEVFVGKVAANLDKLYFAGKRLNSTGGEINGFTYAVEQMGGTVEEAQGSLENLARFMRTTPGAGNLLTRLFGVKSEHLGNTVKMMNDIASTMQRLSQNGQQPLAYRLAQTIGLDEKTMLAMEETGRFQQNESNYDKMLKQSGVDLDGLSKKGMEFDKQLKTLSSSFGLLADRIAEPLIPVVQKLNGLILGLVGASGSTLFASAAGAGLAASATASTTASALGWKSVDKAAILLGRASIVAGMATIPWVAGDAGNAIGTWVMKQRNSGSSEGGANNNNPGNLRSWGDNPTQGGFAVFPNVSAGLEAMAKQLQLYAQRGNDTITGIINKYAPASDSNDVGSYIRDVKKRTGFNPNEHLDLQNPQVLSALMNAMLMHENGRNPFETTLVPSISQTVARGHGAAGPVLNQTTTIHIDGSGNPQATGTSVASEQNRVNSQAVRNLVGAVQ